MEKELFVRAEEVARELGISKPYAYKLVREMNEELKKKGFLTIPGPAFSLTSLFASAKISSRVWT